MNSTILITGGAGFVGTNLALHLKKAFPQSSIVALDNLKRRGSELNLKTLKDAEIVFKHGDVRHLSDMHDIGPIEWLIECSAEPSVHAGNQGGLDYLLDTNLKGALNCLEVCKQHKAKMIFLSSSRIYPIKGLCSLPLKPVDNQFTIEKAEHGLGWSYKGIDEQFPLVGARSLYGSTKLSAELFIEEFAQTYELDAVINRCGVIAGPRQMGKVDQGFIALWLARHLWGGQLSYMGFGGEGLQVRDVLHVYDLADLVVKQMTAFDKVKGQTFNVGGGLENSTSLCKLTEKVQQLTDKTIQISQKPETNPVDIPYYVTDNSKITKQLGWSPQRNLMQLLEDTSQWLRETENSVREIFAL